MNFITKFNKIKEKFKNLDTSKLTCNFAIQVNMTDDDCAGAFYIENKDGVFSVEPYDYIDNTAVVTSLSADFERLITRRIGFDTAINNGKIIINGNIEHVKHLVELFPKPVRKSPKKEASKPQSKKTVSKKYNKE